MRKPMSLPLCLLVVITLLLSLVPPSTMAQSRMSRTAGQGPRPGYLPRSRNRLVRAAGGLSDGSAPRRRRHHPSPRAAPSSTCTLLHYACDAGFDPQRGTGRPAMSPAPARANRPSPTPLPINDRARHHRDPADDERDPGAGQTSPIPRRRAAASRHHGHRGQPIEGWTSAWVFCEIDDPDGDRRSSSRPIAGGSATSRPCRSGDRSTVTGSQREREPPDQGADAGQDEVVGDGNVRRPGHSRSTTARVIADPSGGISGTITIAAYLCPAGVTATDDLIAACTQRAGGQAFSLLTASETLETQTSDAEGDIFFSGVPANDYGIAATLPPGYGEPIVLCYRGRPDRQRVRRAGGRRLRQPDPAPSRRRFYHRMCLVQRAGLGA